MFEKIEYIVKDIQGDYGILVSEQGDEKPVALFFLPAETEVGSKVAYENMEYSLLSETTL